MIFAPVVESGSSEVINGGQFVCAQKMSVYAGMQRKGLTMTIGPSALLWTADAIRNMPPDPDDDDAATDHARNAAANVLEKCTVLAPCSICPVSIDQFEHDILLRWQLNDKGLVLTCPGEPSRKPSLYRERIRNDRAVNPEVLADASGKDLAQCMAWMLAPESIGV